MIDAAATSGYFYVGGHYAGKPGEEVMQGAMYVEVMTPRKQRHRYPIVLFHGSGMTATNWLSTPDGRKGWAQYFLEQGYVIYMVDQPARGRSPWHPGLDGELQHFTAPFVEMLFTATDRLGPWPQAKLHTQWPGEGPGKGRMGDPAFDAFYASTVEFLASNAETQRKVQEAGAALLDRIGPAIVLVHSQAGAFGWLLADARPKLVKAIVAVEPLGAPFENMLIVHGKAREWGPTDIPLTYDPPAKAPTDLSIVREEVAEAPDLARCWMQREPARQLPNLAHVPILMLSAEASFHAVYDHCTARYLRQAGASVDFVRLASVGIHGNGHMMMLEKNNLEIAQWMGGWIDKTVK